MLAPSHRSELKQLVHGPVLAPGDDGFADELSGFNLAVVHQPDVVVGATDAADVAAAVQWAAQHDLGVSVQATGHGAVDVITGGLLVSTRRMQHVEIDPVARTATVGAGVKWKAVLEASLPHGLVGANGSSTDVGVVGYTLGGGFPVLGRAFGFAADYVHSFEVVGSDGVLRHVDAQTESELFSLLKGGKGNFGIVTSMTFGLHEAGDLYGGGIMYPGADAERVFTAFREWIAGLPDAAAPSIALLRLPDAPFVPEPMRGQFVVHVRFVFQGSEAEGAKLVAPMRAVSTPLMDSMRPMSYAEIDLVHMDPADPLPIDEGGVLLRDFDEDTQAAILEVAGPGVDSPLVMVEVRVLGGALARRSESLDCVGGRDAGFALFALGLMVPPMAAQVPSHLRALGQAVQSQLTGFTMVNFHGRPGDAADRARAWDAETYARMKAAKAKWDPANIFRYGHAI